MMTPETWMDLVNWMLLALGAAMAGGTGVALFRFRRTGLFPGQPIDDDGNPIGTPSITSAWVKVAIGGILVLWGLAGLASGEIFGF
ncbi:hypothetical protein DVS28_a4933 [Euzebya pacifica]|uniref:Uncharacterized protein n=1 Tax=Euzebya pacifica TaxID=1608957 RepID=A0A346Y543_9ACTN|nr:hypothetical protein [Euzebya pacifica]AXV09590.1 hypothetical protein DVS28_a4933 [Euzebya pacifica]